jgi:lysophospholipase L1-like esterase
MKKGKWPKFLSMICLWGILFLFIAEVTLRIIGYQYCPLKLEMLGKPVDGLPADWREYHSREDSLVTFDSNLIWRSRKNFKIFNGQGFRGPEIQAFKRPKDYCVFTLGDSNTIGPPNEPAWPDYLASLLKERNQNIKVINAGVWGYSSYQGLVLFREILRYQPDMILISFGSNDAHPVTVSDKDYMSYKEYFQLLNSNFRISQLLSSLQDRVIVKNNEKNILTHRVSLEDYQKNLREFIAIAKKKGIQVIFLTRPYVESLPLSNKTYWRNYGAQYNEVVQNVAAEQVVPLVDIFTYFNGKDEYFLTNDDCHFNDEGRRVAAQIIYDQIKEFVPGMEKMK